MKRTIKHIIIHCAATPNGKDIKAETIDKGHQERGFKRKTQYVRAFNQTLKHIGYHYVIETDGTIRTGRHLEEVGAHVQGSNEHSIGVCMIGTDKFTSAQWQSLRTLLINIAATIFGKEYKTPHEAMRGYRDMGISIKGHRDYSPDKNGDGIIQRTEWLKICPGFDVTYWINNGMEPLLSCMVEPDAE